MPAGFSGSEPPSSPWIFGYGSLIWNPGFPFVEKRMGYLEGWARRFWQGSTDHRGVPGRPGRVVTLVPHPDGCWGVAYRIEAVTTETILAALDHREQGGYTRQWVDVQLDGLGLQRCLTYLATPTNPEYLGPATALELARHIAAASGPSGANPDYVLRLAESLREMGREDPHVTELEGLLRGGEEGGAPWTH